MWLVSCLTAGGLLLLAPTAGGQSVMGSLTLSSSGSTRWPSGAGIAKGYLYVCSGFGVPSAVWKVDTGNVDGPTSTSPTEVNRVQLSSNCYDGVVDDDGLGYWAIYNRPLRVAKTRGGEGAAPMVSVGEYVVPGGQSMYAHSIALDKTTQLLYVGSSSRSIFKLFAGGPGELPSLITTLTLDALDGSAILGLAVNPVTGFGFVGTGQSNYNIVKFTLGDGAGNMTRIGSVPAHTRVQAMVIDPETNTAYVGFYSTEPDLQMVQAGDGHSSPTSVGEFILGMGAGIYSNAAMLLSTHCNLLVCISENSPSSVNYYRPGDGTSFPTLLTVIPVPSNTTTAMVGAIDEQGYMYIVTSATPPTIYKISSFGPCDARAAPQAPQGGPFSIAGARTSTKRAIQPGSTVKVVFTLTRWAAVYPYEDGRRRALTSSKDDPWQDTDTWEHFDVNITLPRRGVSLFGKPRSRPYQPDRRHPQVADEALLVWTGVPMAVQPTSNYSQVFSVTVKLAKDFVGSNLTFLAVAQDSSVPWRRDTALVIPVQAAT